MVKLQQFKHPLTKTEVTYGLISVSEIRDQFPPPNEKIVVKDDEGKQYVTKMHSSAARIDGLTDWYKSHPGEVGDIVIVTINQDKTIKISLEKQGSPQPQEEAEEEIPAVEIPFTMERLVEDFLATNLEHIERGLKLYEEDKVPGRQYSTDIGTIDLLCVDKDNKFVIIEIKKEKGSDKTIGQISRYMGWVKQKLVNNNAVRGIIIVHDIDDKLEYSVSVMPDVQLKYYKVELKFVPKEKLNE